MLILLVSLFAVSCLLSAVWLATRGETIVWRSPLDGSAAQPQGARTVPRHAPRLRRAQQPT